MTDLLEILKYILPSAVVFATAYYLLKVMLNHDANRRRQEVVMNNQKVITPVRLQAYERMVLFLERISPDSLIVRCQKPGMTVKELQMTMLNSIRAEFEHNFAQQLYVNNNTWIAVKSARENVVKLINSVAGTCNPSAQAIELSRKLLEVIVKVETSPVGPALEIVKEDARQII